jgi:hypothetical protein
MKKISQLLFMALMVVFSACSDDDDNNNPAQNNILNIGDNEYELKAGSIEDYGLYSNNLYNFDIVLATSNVTIVDGEIIPQDQILSGIYFELFTNAENDLSTGTYNLVDFQNIANQTFEICDIYENVDVTLEEENGSLSELVSGTFSVLSNGPEYEFEFSGVDNLGQNITGYYKGNLVYLDVNE